MVLSHPWVVLELPGKIELTPSAHPWTLLPLRRKVRDLLWIDIANVLVTRFRILESIGLWDENIRIFIHQIPDFAEINREVLSTARQYGAGLFGEETFLPRGGNFELFEESRIK